MLWGLENGRCEIAKRKAPTEVGASIARNVISTHVEVTAAVPLLERCIKPLLMIVVSPFRLAQLQADTFMV